jgi:WD40 repeat protein
MFDQARKWDFGIGDTESRIDLNDALRGFLRQLSSDPRYGETMVSHSLGYLASAKCGLTEQELLGVLSSDSEVISDLRRCSSGNEEPTSAVATAWSQLCRDLEDYLSPRGADGSNQLVFSHHFIKSGIDKNFLADDARRQRHAKLAEYFASQPLWLEHSGRETANLNRLRELPYQQLHAGLWDGLEATLTDLSFIEAMCASGLIHDLVRDYQAALDALPEAQEERLDRIKRAEQLRKYTESLVAYAQGKRTSLEVIPSVKPSMDGETERVVRDVADASGRLERIRAFSHFVNAESLGLSRFAAQQGFCVQQAYNSASSGPVAVAAQRMIRSETDRILILHHPAQRPQYNPHPALIRTMDGGTRGALSAVSISSDGRVAASGGHLGPLCFWDLDSGECLRAFEPHHHWIHSVSLTADGKRAVTGDNMMMVTVWDLEGSRGPRELKGHDGYVEAVSVTPDGRIAVSGSSDKTLRVWELASGECTRILMGHTDAVQSVGLSADGRVAVSGGKDRAVRVWDVQNGTCLHTLLGHRDDVLCISITPDGKKAVSAGRDKLLRVWDLESGNCLRTLSGHTDDITCASVTPDGRTAISGGKDGRVRVWDLESGEGKDILNDQVWAVTGVSIQADGVRAISASVNGLLRLWDITGRKTADPTKHAGAVNDVAMSQDGRLAVSVGADATLMVWDLVSGDCVKTMHGHKDAVKRVTITPDGRRAVSGSSTNVLRIWDLATGECARVLSGHSDEVSCLALSPDGRMAVSGSNDKALRIWDLETGECLKELRGHLHSPCSAAVLPDGKRIVSGAYDVVGCEWCAARQGPEELKLVLAGTIDDALRLWNPETDECLEVFPGQEDPMRALGLSPDGKKAISAYGSYASIQWPLGGSDLLMRLQVWDLRTGRRLDDLPYLDPETDGCLRQLPGHTRTVQSIRVTPDGRRAVSGGADGTIHIWDLERRKGIAVYQGGSVITSISEVGAGGSFVFGTGAGQVTSMRLVNFPEVAPLTTPVRIWLHGEAGNEGRWGDDITALCHWCGRRFEVGAEVREEIELLSWQAKLSPAMSPCLDMPNKVWKSPGLQHLCPFCHKPLRFNPFIVDNRDGSH